MAKGFITRHRRKLRNKKSRSKRRVRRGGQFQNRAPPVSYGSVANTAGMGNTQSLNQGYNSGNTDSKMSYTSNPMMSNQLNPMDQSNNSQVNPDQPSNRKSWFPAIFGGKKRRPRRSAKKVKRSVRKGRKSRITRRMRGGSNGYTINGAGIGKYTSALANPIPFSAYPLNR